MTLLGILFVVGVAFLATMNFEADMISAERLQSQSDNGVDATVEGAGAILRNSVMSSPGVPFGDSSLALANAPFAEMAGVHNTFSPIEPVRKLTDPSQIPFVSDRVVFNGFFDAEAQASGTSVTPSQIPGFYIDTGATNGMSATIATVTDQTGALIPIPLGLCGDGTYMCDINTCVRDPQNPIDCVYPRVADADGDGIVDSLLVDAKEMGLSSAQLADLATRVNPASNLAGKVSVALRVVPHGGMVNLNESHPLLIQAAFGLPAGSWPMPTDPSVDPNIGFRHGPTQDLISYSSPLEEPLLRRRGIVPPREFQPSLLHGSPLAADVASTGSHLPKQIFWSAWPGGAAADRFQSALSHEFSPFAVDPVAGKLRAYPANNEFYSYWDVMMEPQTAVVASPIVGEPVDYDHRHLVTTVGHDDLLARTAMVETPRGKQDLRQAMIEANWPPPGLNDPNACEMLVPFEYAFYPTSGINWADFCGRGNLCREDSPCRPSALKGRLQLSLPWIDEQLVAANDPSLSVPEQNAYRARVYRIIHDVFYMLVRNAAQPAEVEGMICESDRDCPVMNTVCRRKGAAPPFAPNLRGYCVYDYLHPNVTAFTDPDLATGAGCHSAPCNFPGAICRADGICTLAAPAWSDLACPTGSECEAHEFCQSRCEGGVNTGLFCAVPTDCPGGFCGQALCTDRWTRQRRSEALVSRTAASLTANFIDFADNDGNPNDPSDDLPTAIAIRDFDFTRPNTAGREIDINVPQGNQYCDDDASCPAAAPVCSVSKYCIMPIYVYGLERQPFITEVATFAKGATPTETKVVARAIEFFNPYDMGISLDNDYYIVEVPPGAANWAGRPFIPLNGTIPSNIGALATGPFAIYVTGDAADQNELIGPSSVGVRLNPTLDLEFLNDWTIYLVRTTDPNNPIVPKIVVDQFKVGDPIVHHVGEEGPGLDPICNINPAGTSPLPLCRFSIQRVVSVPVPASSPANIWTWTIPFFEERHDVVTLGTWNVVINPSIHPVEVDFANTGAYGVHYNSPANAAFPTTGSLALLMRHANRASIDFTSPTGTVKDLAFTTQLMGGPSRKVPVSDRTTGMFIQEVDVKFETETEIDNGRIPLFDVGHVPLPNPPGIAGTQSMHHLQPSLFKPWDPNPVSGTPNRSNKALPGNLNTLPWGQLLFDYFTALPLSNGGPYDIDPAPAFLSLKDMPRVDEGGLRVHGRININAAPWTVLSGLPFIPLDNPTNNPEIVSLEGLPLSIRTKIGAIATTATIGPELAQAIVAYRDARSITDPTGAVLTGNYDDGFPLAGSPPAPFGRGWTNPTAATRRGTGFMSVGELANVRHSGASSTVLGSAYRTDAGAIGSDANKNNEDFIDAAAVLIALGDWVSVRSHVFTVYGQIRGADDLLIMDANQQRLDTDARAIRFQETIDRLPVLQGRARPQRIGERTVGRYTDVNND